MSGAAGQGGAGANRPNSGTAPGGIFLARPQSPATGRRLAVKDLLDTAGLTTTYGSALFADHVPTETAEAVRRLEAGGYVNVGKTNLHEFAYGVTSENEHFGTVPNPVAPGRIAGGSSGGSAAALAAGVADYALGTDTGGSIRIPAACCGVVGFKPSFALVSADGCFPLAPSFDHVGPMARSVGACAQMLEVLAPGFKPTPLDSLAEVRIGLAWLEGAEPLVGARIRAAAERLPAVAPTAFPRAVGIGDALMAEIADVHRELYAEHSALYGETVAVKIERCLEVSEARAAAAATAREHYREHALAALEGFDLLVTPTLELVALPVGTGDDQVRDRLTRLTFPFNALGWPALALPCGRAEDGLPASLQIVGRPGADGLVLAAGELMASLV